MGAELGFPSCMAQLPDLSDGGAAAATLIAPLCYRPDELGERMFPVAGGHVSAFCSRHCEVTCSTGRDRLAGCRQMYPLHNQRPPRDHWPPWRPPRDQLATIDAASSTKRSPVQSSSRARPTRSLFLASIASCCMRTCGGSGVRAGCTRAVGHGAAPAAGQSGPGAGAPRRLAGASPARGGW